MYTGRLPASGGEKGGTSCIDTVWGQEGTSCTDTVWGQGGTSCTKRNFTTCILQIQQICTISSFSVTKWASMNMSWWAVNELELPLNEGR